MSILYQPYLIFLFYPYEQKYWDGRRLSCQNLNWPESESVFEIKSLLGFANFYRRFVQEFLKIAHLITDRTKKEVKITKTDLVLQKTNFLTTKTCRLFYELVKTFTSPLFVIHPNAKRQMRLKIDASDYIIFEILSQKQDSE